MNNLLKVWVSSCPFTLKNKQTHVPTPNAQVGQTTLRKLSDTEDAGKESSWAKRKWGSVPLTVSWTWKRCHIIKTQRRVDRRRSWHVAKHQAVNKATMGIRKLRTQMLHFNMPWQINSSWSFKKQTKKKEKNSLWRNALGSSSILVGSIQNYLYPQKKKRPINQSRINSRINWQKPTLFLVTAKHCLYNRLRKVDENVESGWLDSVFCMQSIRLFYFEWIYYQVWTHYQSSYIV